MYFAVSDVDRFIEESNGNKYLVFVSTGENKEELKKDTEFWDEIKNLIKTINGGKEGDYVNDFMQNQIQFR